ncbi:MAG: rhodanese-like domain-containing protein [Gammaproteobacteria bacterium]|jgi:rhodanese-related sulfurtransferase
MNKKYVYPFILFFSLFVNIALAEKPMAPDKVSGAELVTAEQVIELVQSMPNLVIIDARREEEFKRGHIDGAHSILDVEMTQEDLNALLTEKDQPIVFYCNGPRCVRSSNASTKAVSWGYKKIYWFRGGWKEWTDKGYPVSY